MNSFLNYVAQLQNEILPIYRDHERYFDGYSIHGRMHICRAIIFGEWMMEQYQQSGCNSLDFEGVRLAIAFHDSGREGNGPDRWERESAENCFQYVIKYKKESSSEAEIIRAKTVAGYIYDLDGPPHWDVNRRIVHDADVLEIMRPCCGHGGIYGFRRGVLRFGNDRDDAKSYLQTPEDIREQLINEAWNWISLTEARKIGLAESTKYMEDLLSLLSENNNDFPLLSSILD